MARQKHSDQKKDLSLAEEHATARLNKVEDEKEEQYHKEPGKFSMMKIFMPILLVVALAGMLLPLIWR